MMTSGIQQTRALSSPLSAPATGNRAVDKSCSVNCSIKSSPCSSSASAAYPWGTWEDLLLASAVLRHGVDNWTSVSCELQARAFVVPPSLYSAEACKVRFWILDGRFSSCSSGTIRDGKIPWFEEVRKLRVAQLKRELEHYDGSIGLLEQKLKRLKAGNAGVEPIECRDHHKQDNTISIFAQETANCFKDAPACDETPGDPGIGITSRSLLDSEVTQSCYSNCSTAIAGGGEVQETLLASCLKESVTIKDAGPKLLCSCLFSDESPHNGQCGNISDHNSLADGKADQKSGSSKVSPCIENEETLEETQKAESESPDVTFILKVDNLISESEDDCKPLAGEKPVCGGCNSEIGSLGRSLDDTQDLCVSSELESVKCVKVVPRAAIKFPDNVVEDGFAEEDAVSSASAMDLLRIAYADGTPVSTPEDTESRLVEPVRSERSEKPLNEDLFCAPLGGLAPCEPESSCSKKVVMSFQGKLGGAQSKEERKSLGSQIPLSEPLKVSEEAFLVQKELPSCSSGLKDLAQERGFQAIGTGDVIQALSMSNISNSCLEGTVERTKAEQLQKQVIGDIVASDRALSSVFNTACKPLYDLEGDSHIRDIPQECKTKKETGLDCLDCCRSVATGCVDTAKTRLCLDTNGVKSEEQSCETMISDVNSPTKIESDVRNPSEPGLHMFAQDVHPAASVCDVQKGSHFHDCGMHSGIEMKMESSSRTLRSLGGLSLLGKALDHGCDPTLLHSKTLSPLSCQSNDRKPKVNPSFKPSKEERGLSSTVCNSPSVMKAGSKTCNRKETLEGGSKQMLAAISCRNEGSLSPYKVKDRADVNILEEDGLLVDLIKLKDRDRTTLRKRKHLGRGGAIINKHNNKTLSQDFQDEISVHKRPKVSKSEEELGNSTLLSPMQDMSRNEQKSVEVSSGCNTDQAAFSSNVSLLNSHPKSGSKESAAGVFSTRRSRFKIRRLESQVEEPEIMKHGDTGSVQKNGAVVFEAALGQAREPEVCSVVPIVNTGGARADNGFLPDLLILLECLRKISGHRFACLFKIQSDIQTDARYRDLIKRHMDLNTVRSKLEEAKYFESSEFFRDMMLIFTNALVFYPRYSQEYSAARALRENLMREMDRFLREDYRHQNLASTQSANYNELKRLSVSNASCSETTSDGKWQASGKSSCGFMIDDYAADSAGEATSVASMAPQDLGLGKSSSFSKPDPEKGHQHDPVSGRLFAKTTMARLKAHPVKADRSNLEKFGREKYVRRSADRLSNLSREEVSVTCAQGLRKPFQALPRTPRKLISKKGISDKIISSRQCFERPGSMLEERQEPTVGFCSGRSSRRAQQLKRSHSQEIQSYCKPLRRSRT